MAYPRHRYRDPGCPPPRLSFKCARPGGAPSRSTSRSCRLQKDRAVSNDFELADCRDINGCQVHRATGIFFRGSPDRRIARIRRPSCFCSSCAKKSLARISAKSSKFPARCQRPFWNWPYSGSNPSRSARRSTIQRISFLSGRNARQLRASCNVKNLRVADCRTLAPTFPKVSTHQKENSRFLETRSGD